MRKTELIVSGEIICPKTKASIVAHEHTNVEALLDQQNRTSSTITQSSAMSQVGVGDDMDLSFCVEDGFYESATLYGKTLVNSIQEPSSKDVVLPYAFENGQHVTIKDTKESGALGVELKGQTLVNLAKKSTYKFSHHPNEASKYTFTSELNRVSITINEAITQWRYSLLGLHLNMLKPNTKYFVKFEGNFKGSVTIKTGDSSGALTNTVTIGNNNYVIITTNDLSNSIGSQGLFFYPATPNQYPHTYTLANVVLTEYQEGMENWDIPYFEGMTSCKMPILHSVNQMFDYSCATKPTNTGTISFANDGRTLKTNFDVTRDCVNVTNITLPAGTYEISYEIRGAVTLPDGASLSSSRAGLSMFKSSQNWHNAAALLVNFANINPTNYTKAKKTITFDESVTVAVVYHGWNNNPVGWCELTDIRIVPQGKTSILSLPEEVVLRSLPNGVCDTFNTRTGVYTQRVYETTITETGHWVQYDTSNTNRQETVAFSVNLGLGDVFDNDKTYSRLGGVICDKLNHINSVWGSDKDIEGISADQRNVIVQIKKTRLESEDVAGFKTWLTSNNLKVGIQLKVPTITKINLSSTLKSWNTTTHIYSEIPENTLYPILTHSNPTYPVILKPSTKYSIVVNSYSNSHTNSAINFNLGGATATTTVGNRVTAITTPSTLSNELLTMSGRGNKLSNVMVIEGEVVGDEPYFEGICDCKSPILTNTGKNLYYMHQDINNTYGISEFYENGFVTTSLNAWGIFGLTKKDNIAEQGDNILNPTSIQEGKTYTISCKVTKISGTSSKLHFLGLRCHNHEGDVIEVSNVRWNDWELEYDFSNTVELSKTVVCNKSFNHVVFGGQIGFDGSNDVYKITDFQLEESSTPTTYEPYKSNILSANGDKIELTEDMFEQGGMSYPTDDSRPSFESCKDNKVTSRVRSKGVFPIKSGATYSITLTDSTKRFQTYFYDDSKKSIGFTHGWSDSGNKLVFTAPSEASYMSLMLRRSDGSSNALSPSDIDFNQLHFYEVDKTIVLRSLPNGVCDTLNVETGEYVQNIMEFTVGKENSKWYAITEYDKTLSAQIDVPSELRNMFYKNASPIVCDKFPWLSASQDTEHVRFSTPADVAYSNTIIVWINKTKLSSYTANGINDYIKSVGGITVQGRLLSPIVKTVDLEGYPFAYKDGHIVLSSGSIEASLTPKIEYVVQTNRAGAIQANQDRLLNHDKRLAMLEDLVLHQLIQLEYSRAKCTFLSQTRQIFEGGIQMYHTKYELLSEFIEKKLYRSLEEVFEMLDVYFMLGDITDWEYDALYEALMPSAEEIFEVEETFDHEDVEV